MPPGLSRYTLAILSITLAEIAFFSMWPGHLTAANILCAFLGMWIGGIIEGPQLSRPPRS